MTTVFGDTYYFLALMNAKDQGHPKALAYSQSHDLHVTTTAWVLTELADGLCQSTRKAHFLRLPSSIEADPKTKILGPTEELFQKGIALYKSRSDKDWSLTDCISFIFMKEEGLTEALTADHHFVQAGFAALLAYSQFPLH